MEYTALDPRSENADIFGARPLVGIEVTRGDLRDRCDAVIDPQHGVGGRSDMAAIDVVTAMLTGTATLTTESPDLDSLGSMAVLDIAMTLIAEASAFAAEVMQRIEMIGAADRFDKGFWPGRRPYPTYDSPWGGNGSAEDSAPLAAIARAVKDRGLEVPQKVQIIRTWLATGKEPDGYRQAAENARLEMVRALHEGEIIVTEQPSEEGSLVTVESLHLAGLEVGYYHAPVVVALNPEFSFQGGPAQRKFTIAQFKEGYVDMRAVISELNELEPGWGGSPTIAGSPRENGSQLSLEQVAAVVRKHLTR